MGDLGPDLRPGRARVGVGGDDHPVGGHAALRRREVPARAGLGHADDRAAGMDDRARVDRRPGEAPRIGERLDRAGALVEERPRVGPRAGEAGRLVRVEEANRRAAVLPLPGPVREIGQALPADRAMQGAGPFRLAGDAVPGDEIEHPARRGTEEREQPLAALGAEGGGHEVGLHPQARVDEADIAPRAAEADGLALEHHYPGAALREVQGRRQAGIARPHHRHVGGRLAAQRRRVGSRRGGTRPEAVRAGIGDHGQSGPGIGPAPCRIGRVRATAGAGAGPA